MRYYIILLFCFIGIFEIYAQDPVSDRKLGFVFDVENLSFFDNREVRTPYQRSQTLFGSRLGADIGVRLGENKLMAGVQLIKDFGTDKIFKNEFTFYYRYDNARFSGTFGSFPRKMLQRELPDIFVYDSLRYYSPTLQGALNQYRSAHGYAEAYCNWINKQGVDEREIFEIVTDGRFGHKGLYVGWNAQLLHFSVPRPANGLKVYDKIMVNPHLGFERRNVAWFDFIGAEVGLMLSLNRDRNDMVWKTPMGFLCDVRLRKWRIELRDRLYTGNPQFSDYELYGPQLHRGDPYYRSSLYNRTDVSLYLLEMDWVRCYINASFHYTERRVDYSQQVILNLNADLEVFNRIFSRKNKQ